MAGTAFPDVRPDFPDESIAGSFTTTKSHIDSDITESSSEARPPVIHRSSFDEHEREHELVEEPEQLILNHNEEEHGMSSSIEPDVDSSQPFPELVPVTENTALTTTTSDSSTIPSTRPFTHKKRDSYLKSPPYWQRTRSQTTSTVRSLERPAITLHDNLISSSSSNASEPAHAPLFARSVLIPAHMTVGTANSIGSYVLYICHIELLNGQSLILRKRYSDFDWLRTQLRIVFPDYTRTTLPPLPPKTPVRRFNNDFLEKRRIELTWFLQNVLLRPEYGGAGVVREFVLGNEA